VDLLRYHVRVTPNQIHISAGSRGIVDHFFCFTCDEYVWDCDHLIDERLHAPKVPALEPSPLQSFAYDGRVRVLEIEFRVTAPYAYDELPLPPPPHLIQYFDVPRYVFSKLLSSKTARQQERYWENHIRTGSGVRRYERCAAATDIPVRRGPECSPSRFRRLPARAVIGGTTGASGGCGCDEAGAVANACAEARGRAGRPVRVPEFAELWAQQLAICAIGTVCGCL
jgi:hypothetical protein